MGRKKTVAAIVFLFLITAVLMILYRRGIAEKRMQQDIAEEILRLHVVANSDSREDQKLKMEVKESIVTYLRGVMEDVSSVGEARLEIQKRLPEIEDLAREKMQMEGYDYDADAVLGKCYFPVKEYGDMTFPAGEYEALKVHIGKSAGKNWWCVMYPSLCFLDSTYQVVPENSKEKLKENLTAEEYNSLLNGGENVTYTFQIAEWIQNVFS